MRIQPNKTLVLALLFIAIVPLQSFCQTTTSSVSTAGLKYPLLEAAVGTWALYCPDADQDAAAIKTTYPRTIFAFWHGTSSDPMTLTSDPFCAGSGYITGYPSATIDRAVFGGGAVGMSRPWDTCVGHRIIMAPKYNVTLTCTYNATSRALTVRVTGTALTTLTGNWNINAYVVEDSISSLSTTYRQQSRFYPAGSMSCTGAPSWYIGQCIAPCTGSCATCAYLPDSFYAHMQVVRTVLATGGSIWGDASFTNPASGTTATRTYTYTLPAGFDASHVKVIGFVQKNGAATTDREIENAIQTPIAGSGSSTSGLYFTGGASQSMTVCVSSTANPINSQMAVFNSATGTTVNWSVITPASHGGAAATYSTTSTGGILIPTGLSYTPTIGYTGTDSFRVRAADAGLADTTTVHVTVTTPGSSGTIMGTPTLCVAGSTSLVSSVPGGLWTSSATGVATVGSTTGVVSGVTAGTATITYALGCTSAPATQTVTVNSCYLQTGNVNADEDIHIYPNPVQGTLTITSVRAVEQVSVINLLGQTLQTGSYHSQHVQVDVADLPPGVYLVKINCTELRRFVKE